ncbi:hypothetical protein ATANTOWER_026163 [Ataeniobius toweri]|uniref:Secreted protein n=1 Tax=Ataeniobius toweri TaxID=208326 RepID=A0ABU7B9R3_9TELE|nr:hypothetical protein [Ataeniobius toweri]
MVSLVCCWVWTAVLHLLDQAVRFIRSMLPALRRLSVLPLCFGPSSSSLKNLPDLTSKIAKISSHALLAAVGLHNLSFSEQNLSTLQRAAPLD